MLHRRVVVLAALLLPGLGFAQGLPAGRADRLGFAPERLARLDSVLRAAVDEGRVAGVVAIVARQGRVVHTTAAGWADREAARRMAPDALFRIASQSKAVTSVAALMLVEEGRLRLGDPVTRWMPGLGTAGVAGALDSGRTRAQLRRSITIRDLLTHTAGLSYGTEPYVAEPYRAAGLGPAAGYGWYLADKDEDVCTTMGRLAALPLVAQPGERFVYGYGTDVLGCVVQRVAGMPLREFLRTRIFAPLGMRDTDFFVAEEARPRLTAVYAAGEGGLGRAPEGARGQGHYADGPRRNAAGGAGLVSTAGDYLRFLQMLLNGGELDGVRLLAPSTVALLTADQIGDIYGAPGRGFSLGFEVLTDPALAGQFGNRGRYGWGGAYGTTYWVDPETQLTAVFMIQLLPSGGLDLADRFRAMVYGAMVGGSGR